MAISPKVAALRERIRQVQTDLARLKMELNLARMAARSSACRKVEARHA